jgi:polyhydroxyalkanoate synthase
MSALNAPMVSELASKLDRKIQNLQVWITGGLSPVALALAMTDWAWHVTGSPSTLTCLGLECGMGAVNAANPEASEDPRFSDPGWKLWPFWTLARTQHLQETWWDNATHLRGMEHHHQDVMKFWRTNGWGRPLPATCRGSIPPSSLRQ